MNLAIGTRPLAAYFILAGVRAGMAKDSIDVPPSKRSANVGELMRSMGQPLTPEGSAMLKAALSVHRDWETHSYRTLNRMLRMAGRMEISVEEFRSLLPALLQELGLEIPAGVLQPPRGKAGRRPSPDTEKIHSKWVSMGKPPISAAVCDQIANVHFPGKLKGILRGSEQHRRVREQIRQALKRFERRAAT